MNAGTAPRSILFVDDPPVWGGGQVMLRNYLSFVEGCRRTVIRPLAAPEAPEALPAERRLRMRFPAWHAPLSRPDNLCRAVWPTLACARRILAVLREERADLIVANSFLALLPLYVVTAVRPRPMVLMAHTLDIPQGRLSRRLLSPCTRVACCSQAVLDSLHAVPGARKRLVVNADEASPTPGVDTTLRDRLGWPDRWILAYFGRLSPEKNLPALIRGVVGLRNQGDQRLALLIVGDGPMRRQLETLVAENRAEDSVRLVGFLDRPRPVLRAVDAVCLPSLAEPFGLCLLEAQVEGIPVMGTAAGGIPEMILDGQTGVLASGTSAEALAVAIRRLQNVTPGHPMITAARRHAATRFPLDRQRHQFLEVIAAAFAGRCQPPGRPARPLGPL